MNEYFGFHQKRSRFSLIFVSFFFVEMENSFIKIRAKLSFFPISWRKLKYFHDRKKNQIMILNVIIDDKIVMVDGEMSWKLRENQWRSFVPIRQRVWFWSVDQRRRQQLLLKQWTFSAHWAKSFHYNDIRNMHTYLLLKKKQFLIAWPLRFATRTHCDVNKQTDNKHFRYSACANAPSIHITMLLI